MIEQAQTPIPTPENQGSFLRPHFVTAVTILGIASLGIQAAEATTESSALERTHQDSDISRVFLSSPLATGSFSVTAESSRNSHGKKANIPRYMLEGSSEAKQKYAFLGATLRGKCFHVLTADVAAKHYKSSYPNLAKLRTKIGRHNSFTVYLDNPYARVGGVIGKAKDAHTDPDGTHHPGRIFFFKPHKYSSRRQDKYTDPFTGKPGANKFSELSVWVTMPKSHC
jgi:hypothetical protein